MSSPREVVTVAMPRRIGLKLACSLLVACALLLACWAAAAARGLGPLHVPSPDWRDQVIYFVMTDRFSDGDPSNNDQGVGEYDPAERHRFSGGDLKGITRRLDYIQGLGATAVWVTPPVKNQWLDPSVGCAGYHGYWASHFMQVDPHLGTLRDYQDLSRALHGRGMFLVQDIVLNHTGNFFHYGPDYRAGEPERGYAPNRASRPMARPEQPPFDLDDPRRPTDRAADIYHWTPTIRDLSDRQQELTYQLSDLDDLNTASPRVRQALRESYGFWIRQAGVDAFRVDTAFYVEPELFLDFLHSADPRAPGVMEVARRTGRRLFHVFGEGFGIDRPFEETMARRIDAYMTGATGETLMPGMLNFPLYGSLADAFARGRPPAELAWRIDSMMKLHRRPHLMPSFVDNHDVDRFLAGGGEAGLRQALLLLMTLPGIPVIYYGTEQGFKEQRAAMFAGGWGSRGRDWYDTSSPLYRSVASATRLRRAHAVFRRGAPTVLYGEAAGPGALVFRMDHGDETALVAVNTAERPTLVANVPTRLPGHATLQPLFALDGAVASPRVGRSGELTVELPARGGYAWRVERGRTSVKPSPAGDPGARPALESLPERVSSGSVTVSGRARPAEAIRLVLDGDLASALPVTADGEGRFSAELRLASLVDPSIRHALVAQSTSSGAVSGTRHFFVTPAWAEAGVIYDPAGDDTGPAGHYRYPTDPSYAARTMDFRSMRAETAGGALRLTFEMTAIGQVWKPQNGFDHVALTVFVEVPGRPPGQVIMPLQRGVLPDSMTWHYRLRVHGWSNGLFSHVGSGETSEGQAGAGAAVLAVDPGRRTITLTLSAVALGEPATLEGARVYATTWDYDAGYRPLEARPGAFVMGGGQSPRDPMVMDSIGPLRLTR